ncbi:MAG: hypothetical protein H0T73_04800, partial [Ardenticatenales bacterium]|nr:hypothetical protein [Ardenticatenales bacterium]
DQIGTLIGSSATSLELNNPHYRGLLGAGQADAYRSLSYLTNGTQGTPEQNIFAGCQ